MRHVGLEIAEPVEGFEARLGAQQALVLVLAVEVGEDLAQAPEVRDRDRRLVGEGARLAAGVDLAAQDQGFAVELDAEGGELLAGAPGARPCQPELALDRREPGPLAHRARVGPPADQQVHGLDQQGLARAGLARDGVEPGAESNLGMLDQREVADGEPFEHGATGSACGCPASRA